MRMIDADALYEQLQKDEELARKRVLDTESYLPYPNNLNPSYTRYVAQMDERTRLKHIVADAHTIEPEIIRCKDCIYYDPPHVENNGVRYEYDEMPADAFDALGTGLVNVEYGINIGGRCCVDYYCKNYSDDKRVFVREDNYCGRAERKTDD